MNKIITADQYRTNRSVNKIEFWINVINDAIRVHMDDVLKTECVEVLNFPTERFWREHIQPVFTKAGWRCNYTGSRLLLYPVFLREGHGVQPVGESSLTTLHK